jgi:hypothetical protein
MMKDPQTWPLDRKPSQTADRRGHSAHVGVAPGLRFQKSFRSKMFARYNSMNRKYAPWPSFWNEEKKRTNRVGRSLVRSRPVHLTNQDSGSRRIMAFVIIPAQVESFRNQH